MTLNSVVKRMETICLNHSQIQTFKFARPTDFLVEKVIPFAAAFLQDNGGALELSSKVVRLSFRLFLIDLVNVSEETKKNELEVQSDMLSVAEDLLAEFDHSKYQDWAISASNSVTLLEEEFDAMCGGVVVDFDVRIQYTKDTCAIPWKS